MWLVRRLDKLPFFGLEAVRSLVVDIRPENRWCQLSTCVAFHLRRNSSSCCHAKMFCCGAFIVPPALERNNSFRRNTMTHDRANWNNAWDTAAHISAVGSEELIYKMWCWSDIEDVWNRWICTQTSSGQFNLYAEMGAKISIKLDRVHDRNCNNVNVTRIIFQRIPPLQLPLHQ